LRLRVKDIDFGNHRIIVRSAKGANDRSTLLPETLIEPLQFQLKTTQLIHQKDLKEGYTHFQALLRDPLARSWL